MSDDADKVNIAMAAAANAMTTANAFAALFQALIGVLRDNNMLTHSKIGLIFRGAAAQIDAMQPENELQKEAQRQMREMVERVAEGSGIQIPPPGQTGIRRKH
jgi:hypothetical protein